MRDCLDREKEGGPSMAAIQSGGATGAAGRAMVHAPPRSLRVHTRPLLRFRCWDTHCDRPVATWSATIRRSTVSAYGVPADHFGRMVETHLQEPREWGPSACVTAKKASDRHDAVVL